nr:unnamed protein product [Digitaria exilis]
MVVSWTADGAVGEGREARDLGPDTRIPVCVGGLGTLGWSNAAAATIRFFRTPAAGGPEVEDFMGGQAIEGREAKEGRGTPDARIGDAKEGN